VTSPPIRSSPGNRSGQRAKRSVQSQRSIQQTLSSRAVSGAQKTIAAEHNGIILPLEQFGGQPTSTARTFLGAPRLRTIWELQTIAFEFGIVTENSAEEAENGMSWAISLLANNIPVAFQRFEVSKVKGGEKREIPRKSYVLELFSPATLTKAEPLEAVIAEIRNTNPAGGHGGIFTLLLDCRITVTFQQESKGNAP